MASPLSHLPGSITIREVGPRDGLQPEARVPVDDRVRLVAALLAAGVTEIEVAAFVSPKAVPSMDGAAEVIDAVGRPPGVRRWALVPNRKGAELALASGVDAITVTIAASEGYSQRNTKRSVADSLVEVEAIAATVGENAPATIVDAVVSCAFGSPYEGDIAPVDVAALGQGCRDRGVTRVTYADTTGMATPARVDALLELTGTDIGLHLHDTRGTALVCAYAAMLAGVTRFDTAVGGLGGSPYAEGATGNLATDDLVHLCTDLGVVTGIDLDRLLEATALVTELVGHAVPSRVATAGPRWRRPHAS
jgi:hydroxymethylglutaryl-CoA lyase